MAIFKKYRSIILIHVQDAGNHRHRSVLSLHSVIQTEKQPSILFPCTVKATGREEQAHKHITIQVT